MILHFDATREFIYHWCGKFTSPNKDWIHMARSRDDYELMIVTDGILYIADHEHEYAVKKGEYLLMAPTPYQHGTKSGDCEFYWLHFGYNNERQDHVCLPDNKQQDDEFISNSADSGPEYLQLPVTGSLSFPERLIILMKQLQDSDKRYRESTLNRYLCSTILAEISAQCRHRLRKDKELKEQLYGDILDYISWNVQENLRIPEIAAHFGYNEKYLTTLFKKYAGITLKQQILQAKMEVAKSALSESTHPISQIAYSLGFSDAHNFSNAFRKITGLSPSEYRASYNRHNIFRK
ncbi:MAG: helix-turn-helix transcriptional regulator [Lachnospiraceae bacterium]|nr:helix-turn-helix transcriptional regulator [Lachnospiraceae bacterium]